MDFEEFWQENKRFVLSVAGGGIGLLVGLALIDSFLGKDLAAARRSINGARSELAKPAYTPRELADAEAQNEALQQAVSRLSSAVAFVPRPEFVLRKGGGSASSQFFAITSATREDLLRLAGRRGMRLPESLGLPGLSPTSDDEIERTLEAFDVVDRVVRHALDAGVERIDELKIQLDPALGTRKGVGLVERTRVAVTLSGPSEPIVRFLEASQGPRFGAPLIVGEFEVVPARRKSSEARLEITFLAPRLVQAATEIDG